MNKPVAWMMKAREPSLHSPDYITFETPTRDMKVSHHPYPLYTHPVKEQDDYCKAYWGNDNKFVDVFLPNSETEVIRFWNNTHPVKELTDEEIIDLINRHIDYVPDEDSGMKLVGVMDFAKAILRKAQEK